MNILVVRLGALGDVVHTIPAVAALRRAFPAARIDWLVEAKHREVVDLVTVVDRVVVLEKGTARAWRRVIDELRGTPYDVAIDFQGLLKSAVLARASGARRVIGFSIWHLREKTARPFYSSTGDAEGGHVIRKNLRLLRVLGIDADTIEFPIADMGSRASLILGQLVTGPYALINAGAAWPNKRWPPERFGELAAFLAEARGLTPVVLWGPGEDVLAQTIIDASSGRAVLAPPTRVRDLVALARGASLVVSGDTGPLHVATAVGTPTVSIFGPTNPERNGPWSAQDAVVSRFEQCGCHYERRCHRREWCLLDVAASELCAAVQRRLGSAEHRDAGR
jgi:lipopolysaccharide heptosyltransferase I